MAILRWSPVVRRMLKRKRKTNLNIDEVEDGARAANLEEGLTAVIYQYAKDHDYFKGYCANNEQVPFELLKTVERLVHGLEVSCYTYEIWNKAILEGYKVFNFARENRGGFIDVDMDASRISYRPLA